MITRESYRGILVMRDLLNFFAWSVNLGNYSSWLVTWRFCVICEEPEISTDIRDFTTQFWDASSPNGYSGLSREP